MARKAPAASPDPIAELRAHLSLLVGSLEKTLSDPEHTLTLAHRDQLELTYGHALRLRELTNTLFSPSSENPGENIPSSESTTPVRPAGNLPASQSSAPSSSSRRILVVDDKIDVARSLAMLLSLQGHQIETAHDGEGALQAVKTFSPDLVLLDIGLPGMSGYEVAKQLHLDPARKKMILVALTGYGQPEDLLRAGEAGFDAHLVKPASLPALASIISRSRPSP